jgi:putative transposase
VGKRDPRNPDTDAGNHLMLSAEQVAGARTPCKPGGEIRWHHSQPGKIKMADRKLKVKRPRLRHKTEGEVKIPAHENLRQDGGLQQHMLGALLRNLHARRR